jgi:sirohydrochlorin cobaltochelatase
MSESAPQTAIILFAHGSRDPDWAAPFRTIKARIEAVDPELRVELAFLELMLPSLTDAAMVLARTCRRIVIAPLFMGQGAHVKRDLAEAMRYLHASHPQVEFEILPTLGESTAVLDAIGASIIRAARPTLTS